MVWAGSDLIDHAIKNNL